MGNRTIILRRKDFEECGSKALSDLYRNSEASDVTLVSEDGHQTSVHKVIISIGSTYFKKLLSQSPGNNELSINSSFSDLCTIVQFLYTGQCEVALDNLEYFLTLTKQLKIKGLSSEDSSEIEETLPTNILADTKTEVYVENKTTEARNYIQELVFNVQAIITNDSVLIPNMPHLIDNSIKSEGATHKYPKTKTSNNAIRINFCQHCNKEFSTKYKFNFHMQRHTGEKPYLCLTCTMGFSSNDDLEIHTMTHNSTDEKPFKCSQCHMKFRMMKTLKRHMLIHLNKELHGCDSCLSYRSSTYENLEIHNLKHHSDDERPFKCEECPQTFAIYGVFNRHIRFVHRGERSFPCEICGKAFRSKHNLKSHFVMHTLGRPYNCKACSKSFKTLELFKRHRIIHENPWICPICSKPFSDRRNLQIHMQRHNDIKPYICEFCSNSFCTSQELKNHTMYNHTKEKSHICDICSKRFTERKNLQRHLSLTHKDIIASINSKTEEFKTVESKTEKSNFKEYNIEESKTEESKSDESMNDEFRNEESKNEESKNE